MGEEESWKGRKKGFKMKKICSIVLVVCFALQCVFVSANEAQATSWSFREYVRRLSSESEEYMEDEISAIRDVVYSCKEALGIKVSSKSDLSIGESFMVYNEDVTIQDDTVYYPVVDIKGKKAVAIVSVYNTSDGWKYSIDNNWVDEINESGYLDSNGEYVMYTENGALNVENEEGKRTSENMSVKGDFDIRSFESKKRIIQSSMNNRRKVDVEEIGNKNYVDRYTPTVTSELGYYYCNINGAQGQGPYGLCWAATVATIVNYRKGTNITAKEVANAMGIGYNDGGRDEDVWNALSKYGLYTYYTMYDQVKSFSTITKHIQSQYPMRVSGRNAAGEGHSVTLYGYRSLSNGKYIMLWNSALNGGDGGVSIVGYSSSNLVFSTGSDNFTWDKTTLSRLASYK